MRNTFFRLIGAIFYASGQETIPLDLPCQGSQRDFSPRQSLHTVDLRKTPPLPFKGIFGT